MNHPYVSLLSPHKEDHNGKIDFKISKINNSKNNGAVFYSPKYFFEKRLVYAAAFSKGCYTSSTTAQMTVISSYFSPQRSLAVLRRSSAKSLAVEVPE